MKELKSCRKCNMVFVGGNGSALCKKCSAEEEKIFKMVRDYIYENPGTSISDLAKRFNLGVNRIERFTKDGKVCF